MNCQKLRSDIEKLRNEQQKLRELLDSAQDKATVRSIEEKVDSLGDSILEKYMEDFFEKNPEIEQWKMEQLEKFEYEAQDGNKFNSRVNFIASTQDGGMLVGGDEGAICEYRKEGDKWKTKSLEDFSFVNAFGNECYSSVYSIAPTQDGGMLVGGTVGAICEYKKEGDEWKVIPLERSYYVDEKGLEHYKTIQSIAPTPDGGILVGGDDGVMCEYRKEGDEWKLIPLERFKHVNKNGVEYYHTVKAIAPTPDGGMLVGGVHGLISEYRKEGGEWKVKPLERFRFLYDDGTMFFGSIRIIVSTPDGGMLVGGNEGMIGEYRKEGGEWRMKLLDDFEYMDEDGSEIYGDVRAIAPIPGGGMLVGGDNGAICEYRKEGGEWKAIPFERFKYVDKNGTKTNGDIESIAVTPDGGVLVGGDYGALSEYTKLPHTLDVLKEHLAEIAEKGEA